VAPDEKVKGYKYGKTLVPFSMVDEAVLKYEAAKCLQLIGFTSAKNVPRTCPALPHPTSTPGVVFSLSPTSCPFLFLWSVVRGGGGGCCS
jgi:hypothetical protein